MANYRIQQMCDKIAQNAFNEGKQSVIDNIPELTWKGSFEAFRPDNCTEECFSDTLLGFYSILWWYKSDNFTIERSGEEIKSNLQSVKQAKQVANEDYKERIKKALGL